jgi:hypothetical protein
MVKIVIGDVEVRWDGDISLRQLRFLMREAAGIAVAINAETETPEETKTTVALGFTTEVAAYDEPDLSEWFEESP